MATVKYDLYSYQLKPLTGQLFTIDVDKQQKVFKENKNNIFADVFREDLEFYHRRHKLKYVVEFLSNDFILVRLANKKIIKFERDFVRTKFDSEPSCLIAIYNTPEKQIIAIEADKTSFGRSFTVKTLLERFLGKELKNYNLGLSIQPKYEVQEFWHLIEKYEGRVEKLSFEFKYPNSPDVNKTINEELKDISKNLNSNKTRLEFGAEKNEVLTNLSEENTDLSNLAKASAEGAGPAKLKIKGFKRMVTTADNKVKSFEFDELETDLPSENKVEYIEALKKLLNSDDV